MDALGLISRWTHIASVIFLLGGALFARFILAPAASGLSPADQTKLGDRVAAQWKGLVIVLITAAIASGLYNLLRKTNLPPGYHMWFGIKILLALHVIAVSVLLGKTGVDAGKRTRWLTGIAISGLVIVGISAYLRAMQQ